MKMSLSGSLLCTLALLVVSFSVYALYHAHTTLQKTIRIKEDFERIHYGQGDLKTLVLTDSERVLNTQVEVMREDGSFLSLSEVLTDSKTLVARVSDTHCTSCVDSLIRQLCSYFDFNSPDYETIMLVDYTKASYIRSFKEEQRIPFPVISVADFPVKAVELGAPTLFVINSDNSVSHIFIYHKDEPMNFVWYMNTVGKYMAQ